MQIHPDKALAEKLHKENPDQFPDTNHKPEIAVCLSDNFLGFAAFRPLATIRSFLASTPEVQSLPQAVRDKVNAFVGEGKTGEGEADREELRACWREFIGMEGKETESAVHAFTKRVGQEGADAFEGVGEGLGGDERRNLVQAVRVMEKFNSGDGAIFSTM